MAAKPWALEEDLSCPVCCDVYTDPVVLGCSHSFCRVCLHTYWSDHVIKDCPVCRCRSSTSSPPSNLALRNIVMACVKERTRSIAKETSTEEEERENQGWRECGERRTGSAGNREGEARCSLHGERLLLFCKEDLEALCVVCQAARRHRGHQLCPVEEAALEYKEELKASLIPLREKLVSFRKVKEECTKTAQHINKLARETKTTIRHQFEELHHFLRLEEAARLAILFEEEEVKTVIMKEKIEHLDKKLVSLTNTISEIERDLKNQDLPFLQAYKNNKASVGCTLPDPEPVSGALIDKAKHVANLSYKVWGKMQEMVQYTPVTLDPNTAAPWLSVSDDLTSVCYSGEQPHIPNNSERYDVCVCVLGAEAISTGTHSWEVDVGDKSRWDLGVLRDSVSRKGVLSISPANGFWVLALRDGGRYSACTIPPWIHLNPKRKLTRVRVCLDYERGEVSFYDPADMSLIYTFRDTFRESVKPYFSPCVSDSGRNAEPLKICPVKVAHNVGNDLL